MAYTPHRRKRWTFRRVEGDAENQGLALALWYRFGGASIQQKGRSGTGEQYYTDSWVRHEMLNRQGESWGQMALESVATILERTALTTTQDWYELALLDELLITVPMSREQRCSHLPRLFRDLVLRLRSPTIPGTNELFSEDAAEHGVARRKQGYSAAMMVEEARMLQISIFKTLHDNLDHVEFHLLLPDVMKIANEVDAQLSRSVAAF